MKEGDRVQAIKVFGPRAYGTVEWYPSTRTGTKAGTTGMALVKFDHLADAVWVFQDKLRELTVVDEVGHLHDHVQDG